MAKELPYFKFEPSEWENGSIQICSFESKGIFIEICSMYWSRLGELPYALALQKLCRGDESALRELKKHEIFTVIDEQIVIEFLDEQLNEFQETAEKRRKAANKRWGNAKGMQVHINSNAIREDKIREDKKREDIPQWEDFLFYAKEKKPDIDQSALKLKYEAWKESGWQTGGSKPKKIKNWKSTLLNTLPYIQTVKINSQPQIRNR